MAEFKYKRGAGAFNAAKLQRELNAHLNQAVTVTVSPDGSQVLIVADNKTDEASVYAVIKAHSPAEDQTPLQRVEIQRRGDEIVIEHQITTPTGITRIGRLKMALDSPSATPRWVIEYESPDTTELTPWGEFEGELDLSGWDISDTYGGMTLAAAADGHSGEQSLGFTTPDTNTFYQNFTPIVPVPEAAVISVDSLYLKQVSANLTNLLIGVYFYDENGDLLALGSGSVTVPTFSLGNWVAVDPQTIVSPIGARAMRLVFSSYSSGTASVELLRIDDLVVTIPATVDSVSFNPRPRIDTALELSGQADIAEVARPPRPNFQIVSGYDSATNWEGIIARGYYGQIAPVLVPDWYLPYICTFYPWASGGAVTSSNLLSGASYATNDVLVYPIFIPHPMQIGRFGYRLTANTARTLYWGLYTGGSPFGGNLITYTSDPAPTAGSRSLYLSGSSRTIATPGWYYLAWGQDGTTTTTVDAYPAVPGAVSNLFTASGLTGLGVTGKAANPISGGAMPDTLGNISELNINVPFMVLERS